MNILLVTSSYVLEGFNGGGITSYAAEVVNCYKKQHNISVIICNKEQCQKDIPGIKTYHIIPFDISYQSTLKIVNLINKEIKPDLIIHSNANLMSLATPYIADNIKIISICHSLGSGETEIAGFNFPYLDGIVALSNYAKEYIISRFKVRDQSKIPVISNFVAEYPNSDKILKQKMQNTKLKIVYSGGGNCIKSPELIAKVVKKLIRTNLEFEFYWIGSLLPPLHRCSLINNMGEIIPNDSRIKFTGFLSHNEAQRLIAESNIYLLPSRREGCPMSLLEAMRCGAIPIVAEYNIANKEIVSNDINGYIINHKNVNGYVNTIRDIILARKDYSYMYYNSYNYFHENLTHRIWINKMSNLLNAPLVHKKRIKITQASYNKSIKRLSLHEKLALIPNFFRENLPSGISVNMQYILMRLGFDK